MDSYTKSDDIFSYVENTINDSIYQESIKDSLTVKKVKLKSSQINKAIDKLDKEIVKLKADKKIYLAKMAKADAMDNKVQTTFYSKKLASINKEIKSKSDKIKTIESTLNDIQNKPVEESTSIEDYEEYLESLLPNR